MGPSTNNMASSVIFLRDDKGIYSFCISHTHVFFCTDCDTAVDYNGMTCEMCTRCSFCNWKPDESKGDKKGEQHFATQGDEIACMKCFNEINHDWGTRVVYNCRVCKRARVYGGPFYTKGMCWECRPTVKWPSFTPIR